MSNKSIPYIKKRGATYQYVRRVPLDVVRNGRVFEAYFGSRSLFRKSLRTKNPTEAQINALEVEREFELLLERAREQFDPSVIKKDLGRAQKLDSDEIAKFVNSRLDAQLLIWKRDFAWSSINVSNKRALDKKIEARAEQRSISRQRSNDPDHDPLTEAEDWSPTVIARQFLQDRKMHVDATSLEFAALVRAIIDQESKIDSSIQQMIDGEAIPELPSTGIWDRNTFSKDDAEMSPLFSNVANQFAEIAKLRPRTKRKYRNAQAEFLNIVGDLPVAKIMKSDVTKFLDHVSKRQVRRRGMPTQITAATLQSYKVGISAPLQFAIDRDFMEGPNPCSGIKVDRWCAPKDNLKVPRKRAFTIDELKRVFAHPWFSGSKSTIQCYKNGKVLLNDMRYWAPVLAAHTGMRAAELAGLKISDIHLEDEFPHIHLVPNEYRSTKNGEGRYIPILDILIDLGLDDYLNHLSNRRETRVFPDWQYPGAKSNESELSAGWANAKWIRAFNRSVIGKIFESEFSEFDRSPISFHSFRGAFKTLLAKSHPGLLTNAVLGHYQDELDRAYLAEQTPADLYPAFRRLKYEGLDIKGRSQN